MSTESTPSAVVLSDLLAHRTTRTTVVQSCAPLCSGEENRLPGPPLLPNPPRENDVLSVRQRTALALLATGHTDGAVAARVGVHRNTVFNWRRSNPHFAAELAKRQDEMLTTITNRLRMLAIKAIRVVDTELDDPYDHFAAPRNAIAVLRAVGNNRLTTIVGSPHVDVAADDICRAMKPRGKSESVDALERDERKESWRRDPENGVA